MQTADRLGWFLSRDQNTSSDEVDIQTFYSHVMEVEPSSLLGELSGSTLYRHLPPGVRSLIRAFNIVRKWAVTQIAATNIGLKNRQNRIELLLRAVEVCRVRNMEEHSGVFSLNKPCNRSFVEAALTSALISVESRLFQRAWQGVANARGVSHDSVSALLVKPAMTSVKSGDRLTVDPAWLLERLLEVITLPDVMEPNAENMLHLVNFSKRRYVL